MTPPHLKTIPKTSRDMMKLDPRPLKPGDLTYQENARLMAHIAELTQGRDLGPKAIADLDEKEERAMRMWMYAEYKIVPDPNRDYEVVCHRSDWYHALYQLAGDDHLFDMQVSSWDPDWERMPFPGAVKHMHYGPLHGDHSPFRKDEFNRYRQTCVGMVCKHQMYAFKSDRFMEAVHAYYAQDDWMWNENGSSQDLEAFVADHWCEEGVPMPFSPFDGLDEVHEIIRPRWVNGLGDAVSWCTYSDGMWSPYNTTARYGYRSHYPGDGFLDLAL